MEVETSCYDTEDNPPVDPDNTPINDDLLAAEPPNYPGYRKHSSGDLHSRLKTRKLLGVGETDDGDVHRSKLSQILGHSEQLYTRLPRGLRIWQFLIAFFFTVLALLALGCPRVLFYFALNTTADESAVLPMRLYGAALGSLSLIFWFTVRAVDKDVIRWTLLGTVFYFILQTFVLVIACLPSGGISVLGLCLGLVTAVLFAFCSIYFYWNITRHHPLSGYKHTDGWAK